MRTAVVEPNFCISQFWMSERNRISSGSAVATKISPKDLAIRIADKFPGTCNGGINDSARPKAIRIGATSANAIKGSMKSVTRVGRLYFIPFSPRNARKKTRASVSATP